MADISKVKLPDNVTYNLKDSGAVRKTGDTMTGTLTLYKEGTTTQNYPTELKFQNKDTTTEKTSNGYIRAYDGGENGANFVINPAGNMFIGSGEAAQNHYNLYTHNTSENFYATADSNMYLQANGQTIANRLGVIIDTSHNIIPSKADTATNNVGSIGTSSYKWANGYFTNINGVAVGNSPKFTDNNTTYSFGSSTSTITIAESSTDPSAFSVDLTLTKDNVTTALGYTPPTANTDVNVKVNNTNPASGTWYYPVWYTATSGTGNVNANDGFRHYSLQGTASAAGRSILSLGNNTSTGTAGNKRGELFLYSEKSGRAEIVYTAAATATVVHTFPATAGTILNTGTTSFTQSLSSGTKIGTIKINGTSTDLYCQTNTWRPVQDNLTSDSTTDCLSAAQGKALANGSARDGTKLNKYGDDTMSGCLTSYRETTTGNNFPAGFRFSVKDTTTGLTNSDAYIYAYQDHGSTNTYGCNMVIRSNGGMFIGGGESPSNHYLAKGATYGGEDCFITSDGNIYIQTNGNTIANRVGFYIDTSAALIPCKADSPVTLAGSIGTADYRWSLLYVNSIQGGTAYNTQYYDATTQTTGYCMHGRTNGNKYSCIWSSSKLNFYVDTTNVGNVSDRQLKSEIDEIDPKLLEAIAECKIYQYKAFNRDGLISVGIMAQDLVEKCEERGIRPENYELLTKMNFIQGDDTLYYSIDYNQYATFMINYLQNEIKELKAKLEK